MFQFGIAIHIEVAGEHGEDGEGYYYKENHRTIISNTINRRLQYPNDSDDDDDTTIYRTNSCWSKIKCWIYSTGILVIHSFSHQLINSSLITTQFKHT